MYCAPCCYPDDIIDRFGDLPALQTLDLVLHVHWSEDRVRNAREEQRDKKNLLEEFENFKPMLFKVRLFDQDRVVFGEF